jgi:hypothetical protein
MKFPSRIFLIGAAIALSSAVPALAQSGSVQFDARIRASAGIDEPVRQANFYLLRKSYTDIQSEARELVPAGRMNDFIDKLDVSKELKAWMKKNQCVRFTGDDFVKKVTADDIVDVPEFFDAYAERTTGDQTVLFPVLKAKPSDKKDHPEKYDQAVKDWHKAVKEFFVNHPDSTQGLDLGLEEINPGHKWDVLEAKSKGALDRQTTLLAEGKYLAARAQTDLDGRGFFRQVPVGTYYLSSLNVDSLAGEEHERWDVPVTVTPSHETYILLSNINAIQTNGTP